VILPSDSLVYSIIAKIAVMAWNPVNSDADTMIVEPLLTVIQVLQWPDAVWCNWAQVSITAFTRNAFSQHPHDGLAVGKYYNAVDEPASINLPHSFVQCKRDAG
jgi:hypothetical protein